MASSMPGSVSIMIFLGIVVTLYWWICLLLEATGIGGHLGTAAQLVNDQGQDGDRRRDHLDILRRHIERAQLRTQRRRSAKDQRCHQHAEGAPVAEVDDGQGNKAASRRHVGLEDGQVAHAQVESAQRRQDSAEIEGNVLRPFGIDAHRLGSSRALAGCAQMQAEAHLVEEDAHHRHKQDGGIREKVVTRAVLPVEQRAHKGDLVDEGNGQVGHGRAGQRRGAALVAGQHKHQEDAGAGRQDVDRQSREDDVGAQFQVEEGDDPGEHQGSNDARSPTNQGIAPHRQPWEPMRSVGADGHTGKGGDQHLAFERNVDHAAQVRDQPAQRRQQERGRNADDRGQERSRENAPEHNLNRHWLPPQPVSAAVLE